MDFRAEIPTEIPIENDKNLDASAKRKPRVSFGEVLFCIFLVCQRTKALCQSGWVSKLHHPWDDCIFTYMKTLKINQSWIGRYTVRPTGIRWKGLGLEGVGGFHHGFTC